MAVVRNGRFLSDDLAARRLARANGVAVSGTIGVLLHLIHHQQLTVSEAKDVLTLMRQAGYHAPITTIQHFLEKT